MNWAYRLRCSDGSLYAGWTTDMEKRLATHNTGKGAKYTRSRLPVSLAWAQGFPTQGEAMAQEAALKKLTRRQKEALLAQQGGIPPGAAAQGTATPKSAANAPTVRGGTK